VIEDHERIEELLAGYALRSLDGDDAIEADRLLADHVPTCFTCRGTIADFREITGDLALAPEPAKVPDLLLSQIHRSMGDAPRRSRSRFGVTWIAAAASVVALVTMGGISLTMMGRANTAEDKAGGAIGDAMVLARGGGDTIDPVGSAATNPFVEASPPDVRTLHLMTTDCPQPAPGMTYVVWLGTNGTYTPTLSFRPDADGNVYLRVPVDISRYDEIAITEELEGTVPTEPNLDGERTWRASVDS
jgi:anti-sigma-K factor RskA